MARATCAAALAALLLAAPLASCRSLSTPGRQLLSTQGTGPAYWQDASRFPLHYPAAQAAAEGFVASPMGAPTYCNARLVKPVCADGVWVQNRCIAELQDLKVVADAQCPAAQDVFAGAPAAPAATAAAGSSSQPRAILHPIPVTAADLKKYTGRGLVFRGVATGAAGSGADRLQALDSQEAVVEAGTRFWWSAGPSAGAAGGGSAAQPPK